MRSTGFAGIINKKSARKERLGKRRGEREWRESNAGMRTKNGGKVGIPITKRARQQRERSLLREMPSVFTRLVKIV